MRLHLSMVGLAIGLSATASLQPVMAGTPRHPPISAACDSTYSARPTSAPKVSTTPAILNRGEVTAGLREAYDALRPAPSVARGPGFWILVSDKGRVERIRIARSSGAIAVDSAALRGMTRARFAPAIRDGVAVCYWVALPTPGPTQVM
jgi:TonB family protein